MGVYVNLALCFLPLAALTSVSVLKVRSFRLVYAALACAAGFAALVPIIAVQFGLRHLPFFLSPSLGGALVSALVFNGFIEESSKAFFLRILPVKTMTLAAFTASALIAGTTVGSFEAVVYYIAGVNYSPLRLVTAVVLHALCAALSGLCIRTRAGGKIRIAAFVSAVLCHGLYNFFGKFTGFLWTGSLAVLLYALIRLRYFYTEQ